MFSNEIRDYINIRNHELSSDEITFITDVSRHPQIKFVQYEYGKYMMRDEHGEIFTFKRREW